MNRRDALSQLGLLGASLLPFLSGCTTTATTNKGGQTPGDKEKDKDADKKGDKDVDPVKPPPPRDPREW